MSALPAIGTFREDLGGYVGAYISLNQDGYPTHGLIISDKATELTSYWGGAGYTLTDVINGPGNFSTMLANSEHSAVAVQSNLNDAEHGGHDDWYIPSILEIDAIYWELKPTTFANGDNVNLVTYENPYAVPQRSGKTTSSPGQTSVEAFQAGGDQAFRSCDDTNPANCAMADLYWTSYKTTTGAAAHFFSFGEGSPSSGALAANRSVRAIRRVPVSELVAEPPTEEETFQASFEDASGRDPLPTALLERTPAKRLANHNVIVYKYPPYIVTKRVPVELEDYDLTEPGKMIWHKDSRSALFSMGRWAQIQGRRFTDSPLEVELTLRISDHPESFEAPT